MVCLYSVNFSQTVLDTPFIATMSRFLRRNTLSQGQDIGHMTNIGPGK